MFDMSEMINNYEIVSPKTIKISEEMTNELTEQNSDIPPTNNEQSTSDISSECCSDSTKYTVTENPDENNNNDDVVDCENVVTEIQKPTVKIESPPISPIKLAIGKIVEYGRSDVSSDSDNDSQRVKENRKLSFTRTRRNRMLNQHRKSRTSEEESIIENEAISKGDDTTPNETDSLKSKRRRHGVSAEPVRVSWRETFRKLQLSSNVETAGQSDENDKKCEDGKR